MRATVEQLDFFTLNHNTMANKNQNAPEQENDVQVGEVIENFEMPAGSRGGARGSKYWTPEVAEAISKLTKPGQGVWLKPITEPKEGEEEAGGKNDARMLGVVLKNKDYVDVTHKYSTTYVHGKGIAVRLNSIEQAKEAEQPLKKTA
jgi:hypothetical protein